jgi:hypothetical protein
MESTRNVNLRQLGLGEQSRIQNQQKIYETERKNKAAEDAKDADRAIRQQRADVYEYKAKNPNLIIKEDSSGNLIGIDPASGKSDSILDTDGNPVKSAIMTDAEKLKQVQDNKEKEITLRGTQSRLTEGFKQADRKELESSKQIDRLELKREVPGSVTKTGAAAKPLLPTQQKQDNINKALQAISNDPTLKPYVKFEKNNAGTVTGVSIPATSDKYFAGMRGYNENDRMRAYNAIFGQAPVPGISQTSPNQPKSVTRDQAIKALNDSKIPVNEANIKKAMDPSNWK